MKKAFVTLCVVALAISGAFAQKVKFPTDEKGKICFTNEATTTQSKADLFEEISAWSATHFSGSNAIISQDEDKGELLVNGAVKTKSAYNPFSGNHTEVVNFVIKFVVADGKISYTMHRFTLTYNYIGYGTSSNTTSMDQMYINYVQAYDNIKKAKSDPSISKKDQRSIIREAESVINDTEDSLEEAEKELRAVVKSLENSLLK